jgi:transposase
MPRNTKTQQLTPATRGRIYQGHIDGLPVTDLANQFNCTRRTIYRTLERYESLGSGKDRPRPGQPRTVNTTRTKRRILGEIQKDKWGSWVTVAERVGVVSSTSVQRAADENGIHRCVALRKPPTQRPPSCED